MEVEQLEKEVHNQDDLEFQVNELENDIEELKDENEKLKEALKSAVVIHKYYDDTYSNHNWDTCCSGRDCGCMGKPTDPEYYIYQELKKMVAVLKEIEGKNEN